MSEVETEIQAENAPPERPDWLPSNFDKPEDLAKSYSHATQKITEQGQKLSSLEQKIQEIQSSQYTQQAESQAFDIEQGLYDAYESGDGRAIAAANAFLIQQAVAQQASALQPTHPTQIPTEMVADYAERSITAEFPDWPEYKAKVAEAIQSDPVLYGLLEGETNPANIAAVLKTGYKIAKYDTVQSATADATKSLEDLSRVTKQAAQTMSGTNSSTEAVSEWDIIKAARTGIPRFGG